MYYIFRQTRSQLYVTRCHNSEIYYPPSQRYCILHQVCRHWTKISRVDFQRDMTTSSEVIDYTPFFIKTCSVLHEASREQTYGKSSRYLAQTTRLCTGILENPQEKCLCECFLDSVPIISRLHVDAIFRLPYWRTRLYNFARNISTSIWHNAYTHQTWKTVFFIYLSSIIISSFLESTEWFLILFFCTACAFHDKDTLIQSGFNIFQASSVLEAWPGLF